MSRCARLSVWSTQMFHPGAKARLTSAITMGSRAPEAQCSSSCMSASPCPEVAVKVRTPVLCAPMRAAMQECSLSTRRKRAFIVPEAQYSERNSTMCVWGVIG